MKTMVHEAVLPDRLRDTEKLGPQQNSKKEMQVMLGPHHKGRREFWEHTRDAVPTELRRLGVSLDSWEQSFDGVKQLREQQDDSERKLMIQIFHDDMRFLMILFSLACILFVVSAISNAAISVLCLILVDVVLWLVHTRSRTARTNTYHVDRISAEADWTAFIDQQKELYRGLVDFTTLQVEGYTKELHWFGSRHSQTVGLLFRFEWVGSATFVDDFQRLFQLLQSSALTSEEYETAKTRLPGTSNTKEQLIDSMKAWTMSRKICDLVCCQCRRDCLSATTQ